ncbi:MAG: hypothetical protein J1F32_01775 [Erysipelotrichales bacterium]|nr:hypothetical protein [Erysipelotrichales bacterium]
MIKEKSYLSDFYLELKIINEYGKQKVEIIKSDSFLYEMWDILILEKRYSVCRYLESIFKLYENNVLNIEDRDRTYHMRLYKWSTAPRLKTIDDYKKFYGAIRSFLVKKYNGDDNLPF